MIYGSFNYKDENGTTHEYRNWMTKEVAWTATEWTWICFSIYETIINGGKYDGLTVKGGIQFF